MSGYAFIPRHYDLRQLDGIHRTCKQLFPQEPLPALTFPKPGQTIRLVTSTQELPPPAFPKPSQFSRWARDPQKAVAKQEVAPDPIAAITPAWIGCATESAYYLQALSDLAHEEISYEAIKDDYNIVIRCFGPTPDHELFARGYEQYRADGTVASEGLERVYRHYGWWLNLKRAGGAQ